MTTKRTKLARAREELAAANGLIGLGFPTQATSRSYYAAFYAAEAALLAVGQERSRHGGVVAAFGRYVVKEGGLDPIHGRTLNNLLDRRSTADYDEEAPASTDEAKAAIDGAEAFVDAIASWLASRGA